MMRWKESTDVLQVDNIIYRSFVSGKPAECTARLGAELNLPQRDVCRLCLAQDKNFFRVTSCLSLKSIGIMWSRILTKELVIRSKHWKPIFQTNLATVLYELTIVFALHECSLPLRLADTSPQIILLKSPIDCLQISTTQPFHLGPLAKVRVRNETKCLVALTLNSIRSRAHLHLVPIYKRWYKRLGLFKWGDVR